MHDLNKQTLKRNPPVEIPLQFVYYRPRTQRAPDLPALTPIEQMYAYYRPELTGHPV
jgi:hypothetical protein